MSFKLGNFFPKKPINEVSLKLDDARWKELEGGYRGTLYDASVALNKLEQAETLEASRVIYQELWNELHHQGDVGIASYYAVPHLVRISVEKQLVDYNVLALVSLIEISRHKKNPKLPKALEPIYNKAISDLEKLVQIVMQQDWNLDITSSALTAIALSKKQLQLAEAIFNLDSEDVIDEFLEDYR